MAKEDNPNLRKNGGKGTLFGNLLRGLLSVGKTISPQLGALIDGFQGGETDSIQSQLAEEGFDDNELKFLLGELGKDKTEMEEVTKRWEADMSSDSWLSKNVRPATLWLYNISIIILVCLDSYVNNFEVKSMWMTILLTNSGMINTAYFGSRYLEKRDTKKYK